MATQDAPRTEVDAARDAVSFERFLCVARAARIEATRRSEQWTECVAIEADERGQDAAHCRITARQCFSRLRAMAALSASRAPERALTTMSTAGSSCWCWRKDSRTRRLIRLRRTALPMMRAATDNPSRGPTLLLVRAKTANEPSAKRRASRYVRSNSDLALRRCAGLNGRADSCKSIENETRDRTTRDSLRR